MKSAALQRQREAAIYKAKLLLGFGDIDGWAKPCEVDGCGSSVSRKTRDGWRCWNHWDGPLQLEFT